MIDISLKVIDILQKLIDKLSKVIDNILKMIDKSSSCDFIAEIGRVKYQFKSKCPFKMHPL
jgi:hypothetical protein